MRRPAHTRGARAYAEGDDGSVAAIADHPGRWRLCAGARTAGRSGHDIAAARCRLAAPEQAPAYPLTSSSNRARACSASEYALRTWATTRRGSRRSGKACRARARSLRARPTHAGTALQHAGWPPRRHGAFQVREPAAHGDVQVSRRLSRPHPPGRGGAAARRHHLFSGNHAQALAAAGRLLGIAVTVVMPNRCTGRQACRYCRLRRRNRQLRSCARAARADRAQARGRAWRDADSALRSSRRDRRTGHGGRGVVRRRAGSRPAAGTNGRRGTCSAAAPSPRAIWRRSVASSAWSPRLPTMRHALFGPACCNGSSGRRRSPMVCARRRWASTPFHSFAAACTTCERYRRRHRRRGAFLFYRMKLVVEPSGAASWRDCFRTQWSPRAASAYIVSGGNVDAATMTALLQESQPPAEPAAERLSAAARCSPQSIARRAAWPRNVVACYHDPRKQ